MILAIDCFKLVKGFGKSIGIYNLTHNLVANLAKYRLETDEKNVDIVIFGNKYNKTDFDIPGVRFIQIEKYDPLNKVHNVIWELFTVSSACKRYKADKILFPRGYCALTHPAYDMIIIHDLIPFYYHENYPGVFNRLENFYIMNRLKASARTCKKIITISEYSKKDISTRFQIDPGKINVIYNGCNRINSDSKPESRNYICSITGSFPHKNADGLIKAYIKYCEITDNPCDLVIIGLENTDKYKLDEKIRKKITCYKYLEKDADMYRIIKSSRAFVFLSLIEGFGFPPIEAMQLEVPVVCSNATSLPEVTADAAILVNPLSSDDVANAIREITENETVRTELIQKGKVNTERFAWKKQIKQYWDTITS